jgi:hypothetical protein
MTGSHFVRPYLLPPRNVVTPRLARLRDWLCRSRASDDGVFEPASSGCVEVAGTIGGAAPLRSAFLAGFGQGTPNAAGVKILRVDR